MASLYLFFVKTSLLVPVFLHLLKPYFVILNGGTTAVRDIQMPFLFVNGDYEIYHHGTDLMITKCGNESIFSPTNVLLNFPWLI